MVEGMKPAEFNAKFHENMQRQLSPAKKNMFKVTRPEHLSIMYVEPEIVQASLRANGRLPKAKTMKIVMSEVVEGLSEVRDQTSNPEDVWVPLSRLSAATTSNLTKTGKPIEQVVAEPSGIAGEPRYIDAFESDGLLSPYGVVLKEQYVCAQAVHKWLLGTSDDSEPLSMVNGIHIPFLEKKGAIGKRDLRDIQRGAGQCLPRTVQLGDPFVIMNDGSGRPPLVERVTES